MAAPVSWIPVGANDNEKISLDLSAPGFSVEALGLKDLVISGISGKVTNVTTLTGLATNMAFSNPAITVNYVPASGSPQLVRSSGDNRQYVQSSDADGKPVIIWPPSVRAGTPPRLPVTSRLAAAIRRRCTATSAALRRAPSRRLIIRTAVAAR